MISGLDLSIYRAFFQQKKLTEKYIGKVEFEWVYSEVHYTAECTVGVPFDLFDKTIVGILLVDEVLTIEEIGDILGMNIIHNPEKQQYRDDAEFDILRMALDNLYLYKMIEIGDTFYSSCRLTGIGKEYAQKGRKFKIESHKPFTLVYDHTSENHTEAQILFKNLKGNPLSLINHFDFLDETLMKQIASKQTNDVYDQEKGNSFTNPKIDTNKSQSFSLKLYVALLYDLESGDIRLMAYEPTTKTINEYLSNWLNENKSEDIISQYKIENPVDSSLPILPQTYIEDLVQVQKSFEEEIIENPANALAITKKINKDLDYIDIAYFWNNLNDFVSEKTKECWFFLPEPNGKSLSLIEKFAEYCPQIFVFVCISNNITDESLVKQISKLSNKSTSLENNLFTLQIELKKTKTFKFQRLGDSLCEYDENLVSIRDNFGFSSLIKNSSPSISNYKSGKSYLAREFLPLLHKSILQTISEEIKDINKRLILSGQSLDKKALIFTDLQEHEAILQQVFQIEQQKNKLISTLKEKHQIQLQSELEHLVADFEKQEFAKLESLQEFKDKLQTIYNELFDDYKTLQEGVTLFENKLKAEDKRIRDEILAKTYIIDTNVFIEEPEIISKIESKHYVALTLTAIEELDKLKMREKTRKTASKAIKNINEALQQSNKQKKPRVKKARANLSLLPEELQKKSGDNYLLSIAKIYEDENPVILTIDKNLQSKAIMLNISVLTLKEFLSEQPEPSSIKSNNNGVDYKGIFKQIQPNKDGKYPISSFIAILKKQKPEFDYKILGFEKAWQFVDSLDIFEVTEKQFLNLKS